MLEQEHTLTRRTRRHEETRREILIAAWAQAEEHGIAALSLRELARAVGMRAPSLYTYFDGKDAIYDAMFAEGYRALLDSYEEGGERDLEGPGRMEALGAAVERFVAFCQASPARYQLMFTRAIPGWEPSPESYAVSVEVYRRLTELLAAAGIEGDGALDLWTAVTSGLAAQQMANDPGGDRWRRLSRPAVQMMVEYLDRTRGTIP